MAAIEASITQLELPMLQFCYKQKHRGPFAFAILVLVPYPSRTHPNVRYLLSSKVHFMYFSTFHFRRIIFPVVFSGYITHMAGSNCTATIGYEYGPLSSFFLFFFFVVLRQI